MKKYLKGIGASEGVVEGRAVVILNPDQVTRMKEGYILVAPTTNPLYTSALLKAKAVVTDTGGMLCHTAIVARELNIPCVVGTKRATTVLKSGQLVTIDGKKGTITYE